MKKLTGALMSFNCVVDLTGRQSNLASAMERGLPVCTAQPERTGALAIVGSGPSVRDYIHELKHWPGDIWAINGAYDFLLEYGITPAGFVGVDPLPGLSQYVAKARRQTTFYIASTCDPAVLDRLEGCNVMLWHPEADGMEYPPGLLVNGGTTVATRAPFLAHHLGWRDITIFGVDSSYDATSGPYAYRWGIYECDIDKPIQWVECDGKGPFPTEIGLINQVSQLGAMLPSFEGRLKVRCGGLMKAFLDAPMLEVAA